MGSWIGITIGLLIGIVTGPVFLLLLKTADNGGGVRPWIGIAIGFLVGIVTGAVFLLLLKTADRLAERGGAGVLKFTAELLTIPGLWFGGGYLTSIKKFSSQLPPGELIMYYLLSLAIFFALFAGPTALRWAIRLGEDLGKRAG